MFIREIIGIVGNSKRKVLAYYTLLVCDLDFTPIVGLRPRVYYTLTNFRGGGGGNAPLAPPPSIRQ